MNKSRSSLRIAGLGGLLKIGSLAAVTYLVLKRITRKQSPEWIPLQRLTRPHRRSYTAEDKADVRRIKIESSSPPTSSAVPYDQSNLAKGHVIAITGGKGSEEEKYPQRPKTVPSELERAIPLRVIENLRQESKAAPRDQYLDKESPAHILAGVKEPETMQALDDTLSRPAHAAKSNLEEGLNIEPDEKSEKIAAIEAIECMAAEGNPEAKNLLFKHVQNEDFSVRHEAIRGILQHGGREDRELLQQTLPAGDWYIMDIRPEDMRKVC